MQGTETLRAATQNSAGLNQAHQTQSFFFIRDVVTST